jgi:hypothetical protein
MIRIHRKKRGQSAIELAAVITFILAAFIVFQKYIVRGFSGRWKGVGDTFGQGRLYDPKMTIECAANKFFTGSSVVWYNQTCFEKTCGEDACLRSTRGKDDCEACLASCKSVYCDR